MTNRTDRIRKASLVAAASVAALFAGAGAQAQTTDDSAAPSATARTVSVVDQLDEVVVTAQKREEKLQNVPISISVLGGKELDRSTSQGLTEVLRTVPGVATTVAIQGGGSQIIVRGVAPTNPVFNGASPVAYYLDGVPVGAASNSVVPDADVYDLERVEVLRGPQGTLYGAGGMGGVVRLLTHDAELDAFDFKARASVSSTAHSDDYSKRTDLAINVPLVTDKLAVRGVLSYRDTAGWVDRPGNPDANTSEAINARLRLRAEPTDRLSLGLTAWISRDEFVPSYSGDNRMVTRRGEPGETNYDIYSANIGYDFGAFALSNTVSYFDYTNDTLLDLAAGAANGQYQRTIFETEVLTNELTLSSTSQGAWRWSLGGIYRDAEDRATTRRLNFDFTPSGSPPQNILTDKSTSWAVYGEITRVFMDGRAELTIGGRYFEDRLISTELERRDATAPFVNAAIGRYADSNFDAFTPRVTLTVFPSPDVTAYASYSQGFRSGYNQGAQNAANFAAPQPDTLNNYEVGLKGRWLDGRLNVDAAVYYLDWRDSQQQLLVLNPEGLTYSTIGLNSEGVSGPGFEFAVTFIPIDRLTLSASYAWNDLGFDADVVSGRQLLFPKGSRPNFSAQSTAGISLNYDFPLAGGFEGRLSTSVNYSSKLPVRRASAPSAAQPLGQTFVSTGDDITLARAAFELKSPGAHWTATLFVDNLTNEDGVSTRDWLGALDWDTYTRPRTIGLQFEYQY